jgi:hypothetical protein
MVGVIKDQEAGRMKRRGYKWKSIVGSEQRKLSSSFPAKETFKCNFSVRSVDMCNPIQCTASDVRRSAFPCEACNKVFVIIYA